MAIICSSKILSAFLSRVLCCLAESSCEQNCQLSGDCSEEEEDVAQDITDKNGMDIKAADKTDDITSHPHSVCNEDNTTTEGHLDAGNDIPVENGSD